MNILDRFFKYIKINTQSNENSKFIPSTQGQTILLEELDYELKKLNIKTDFDKENGILYAKIFSNIENKSIKSVGFIAHVDTAPEVKGENVKPQIIENYDGNNIILNKDVVLKVDEFPEILGYKNKSLIVTDGRTLLGADDKAGVAEIMTMAEYVVTHQEIVHGEICIAFTSDEEIGRGTDHFDIKRFGADVAYTIDGEKIGEISDENFNAVSAKIMIRGKSIHPGYAKDRMINASDIACEFNEKIPKEEIPQNTEKDEGFYYLVNMTSNVEKAEMTYNLRDFDKNNLEKRMKYLEIIANEINRKYGKDMVEINFINQYENMKESLKNNKILTEYPKKAGEKIGIQSFSKAIRGGTDGASLTTMGLPCPNLGAGGRNFHSIYEYICIEDMSKISQLLIEIVKLFVET